MLYEFRSFDAFCDLDDQQFEVLCARRLAGSAMVRAPHPEDIPMAGNHCLTGQRLFNAECDMYVPSIIAPNLRSTVVHHPPLGFSFVFTLLPPPLSARWCFIPPIRWSNPPVILSPSAGFRGSCTWRAIEIMKIPD
jgi:hypothetical protein